MNQSELEKTLFSIAKTGLEMVSFDNLTQSLGNGNLDANLTSEKVTNRKMRTQEIVELDQRTIFYANGNNISTKGDTARRVILIRLLSTTDHPENRKGFKHKNLIQYIEDNRAKFVSHILTIIKYYLTNKKKMPDLVEMGSFENWSQCVRGTLVSLGMPDPYETRKHLLLDDDRTRTIELVFQLFEELPNSDTGYNTTEILSSAIPEVRTIIDELMEKPTPCKLGKLLGQYKDTIHEGKRLEKIDQRNKRLWRITKQK